MSSLSVKFAEKFGIKLTDDLISWFDDDLEKDMHFGEFNAFVNPEELMEQPSEFIWGGQMLPDTLPIAGNGCGDVLSLRFGSDGTMSEVVCWDHEGGQWSPWGKTLAEAMLWDLAEIMDTEDYCEEDFEECEQIFSWVLNRVISNENKREELRSVLLDKEMARIPRLLDFGLCEIKTFSHMCEKCLSHPFRERARMEGGVNIAQYLGVDWETIEPGIGEPALIPGEHRDSLAKYLEVSVKELVTVDWAGAAEWAEKAIQKHTGSAWPFAVLRKYAEKHGSEALAAKYFALEMQAFTTTYDFTESWLLYPYPHRAILERFDNLLTGSKFIEFIRMKANQKTRDYWLEQARKAEKQNNYSLAYRCWYSAGWDEFFTNDMDVILQGLFHSAEAAGYKALAGIARYHIESL